MKLSPTQWGFVKQALDEEVEHGNVDWYLEACVLERSRIGLVRAGAVVQDDQGHWHVSDEAQEGLSS